MDLDDEPLARRLRSMEASVDVPDWDPTDRRRRPRLQVRGRVAALLVIAGILVLTVGATATKMFLDRPLSAPGAFAPGQPLHCSGIEMMRPLDAEVWLDGHGITVLWQSEDRASGQTPVGSAPPADGVIRAAAFRADGTLLVVVVRGPAVERLPIAC